MNPVKAATYKPIHGILFMVAASALFALMAACAKHLSADMTAFELVFWRNFVGIFLMLFWIMKTRPSSRGGKPWLLLFRGCIGFAALLAYFYNITQISLADATTYSKTEPIFTALIAFFLLKERLSASTVMAVLFGFCGIALIGYSHGATFVVSAAGIISGLFAAMAYTSIRQLRDIYDARVIVLSFMTAGVAFPLLLASLGLWSFSWPSAQIWPAVLALGTLAAAGQYFMTKAYFYAKAGVVGVASYTNLPFAMILGLLMGDAWPSQWAIVGMCLVAVSGAIILWKND